VPLRRFLVKQARTAWYFDGWRGQTFDGVTWPKPFDHSTGDAEFPWCRAYSLIGSLPRPRLCCCRFIPQLEPPRRTPFPESSFLPPATGLQVIYLTLTFRPGFRTLAVEPQYGYPPASVAPSRRESAWAHHGCRQDSAPAPGTVGAASVSESERVTWEDSGNLYEKNTPLPPTTSQFGPQLQYLALSATEGRVQPARCLK
jgi:hypothetical protein